MRNTIGAALAAAVVCMGPALAVAAEVVTPLLDKDTFDDFACMVYNANEKPIDVTIEIFDPVFNKIDAGPITQVILPGRRARLVTMFGSEDGCRVSGKFSRRKTLVTFCVIQSGAGRCDATVTLP